ncbi:DUF2750 domain-containing protein [Mucilaginibacter pallidiroseus]|uniref:DUF2750 domain-containing protein n=1 Tax=Mucilaginibacter pallidiroseus TaxID=2599295 RepID=A0A563U860_9SPHI|nr:DUF2750 domain-containing protein [Mucilaginibacter pallidiroseus]TWR27530.1 DUF2750 domain-containing protein [Mucilaginibacter pallidiroseus]
MSNGTIDSKHQLFIEKVSAAKIVWGLKNKEGWANSHSREDEQVDVIPFWSDRALAKASARDDWKGYTPTEILLSDFLENWCTGMAENDTLVGTNWDANMNGAESDALEVALQILLRLKDMNSAIKFKNYGSLDDFIADIANDEEEEGED